MGWGGGVGVGCSIESSTAADGASSGGGGGGGGGGFGVTDLEVISPAKRGSEFMTGYLMGSAKVESMCRG